MTIEKKAKRIMAKYSLRSIGFTISPHGGVSATAHPDTFNALVGKRRSDAFASAESSLSMAEATQITTDAMKPVASGMGSDFEQALISLESDLAKAMAEAA